MTDTISLTGLVATTHHDFLPPLGLGLLPFASSPTSFGGLLLS